MTFHPALAMIERNNEWYAAKAGLGHKPSKQVAVVTCMDCRLDPHRFLGLEPGSAHVLRNAGGRVADALRSLIISQQGLGTHTVVIIHHTECGARGLKNEQFQNKLKAQFAVDSCDIDFLPLGDEDQSVLDDIDQVRKCPFIPSDVRVYGFVYDVKTGAIRQVKENDNGGRISDGGTEPEKDEILVRFEEGNARYRASFINANLGHKPSQKLAIVTCMDCRLDHLRIVGMEAGEAHVITNAGGRAEEALRSLILSQQALGTTGVAVIHHTECGANALENDSFRLQLKKKFRTQKCDIDFLPFRDLEQSVLDDVQVIKECPFIPNNITVMGYVYDVKSGELRHVDGLKKKQVVVTAQGANNAPKQNQNRGLLGLLLSPLFAPFQRGGGKPEEMGMETLTGRLEKANAIYAMSFREGKLFHEPSRKVAVLTCMDCRLDPVRFLGLGLGEAHIIRNAGGRAADALRSLIISQQCLGTNTVVVIHHTKCGMAGLNVSQLKGKLRTLPGVEKVDIDFLPFGDLERSVIEDVNLIKTNALVPDDIEVYGYVYDVQTGTIYPVKDEAAPIR